jgi:nucleotide-binding universal stress UspA family protein
MSWFPKRTVVVPVDYSEESFAAVDVALDLAAAPDGVRIVHVLPEPAMLEPGIEWQQIDNELRSQRAEDAIRQRLADPKYQQVQIDIEFGDPGYRIADFAKNLGADLIVTPSHGRTGLERVLLGSVAERVIRLSHCPVLVLRT